MNTLEETKNVNHEDARSQLNAILEKQRVSYLSAEGSPAEERIDRLSRCANMLDKYQAELVAALAADYGHRSAGQTRVMEIYPAISACKHAIKHVSKWMKPKRKPLPLAYALSGAKGWIYWQPKGVVGVISPWNYPINLTFIPVACILAAGNRAMLKPSRFTPRTSELFGEMISKTFDETELVCVAPTSDISRIFSELPFNHLIFTGSISVGSQVMGAAAKNLVPVTLELGGKSPVIIGKSANMEQAVWRMLSGKLPNSGQTCISPDYVFVPQGKEELFIDIVNHATAEIFPTVRANKEYTPLINQKQVARIQGYIQDAEEKGAKLIPVNPANEEFAPEEDACFPLTIVLNATEDMLVMQEEIFAPLLPVLTYRNIEEVIQFINSHGRPLALYYFGQDEAEKEVVLSHTTSGGVTVNGSILHASSDALPFGGVGASGMGRYHGYEGFVEFSHPKPVFEQGFIDLNQFTRPPFTEQKVKLVKWFLGI
ncbi:MAG: coniferyl aldehyde dehydrogenase [Anaerolineales bacterium]|nr:coniferyl aldehyde dehydrogenase [Anaerolineales bacterium]